MNGEKEIIGMRNHISYVLEHTFGIIVFFGIIFFGNLEMVQEGIGYIKQGRWLVGLAMAGGIFLILIVGFLWNWNRWYRTTLTVQNGTVTYARKTLLRSINTISVINISNINIEQNMFEMIMGTCKLKIDTSSLSTANDTDLQILLKKDVAQKVKNLILEMVREIQDTEGKGQAIQNGEDKGQKIQEETLENLEENKTVFVEEDDFTITYTTKEVIANGFASLQISQIVAAVSFAISSIISTMSIFIDVTDKDSAMGLLGAVVVQVFVMVWALNSIVKKWLDDYHFRAKREGDKIYVSCGLFKKRNYAVPVDKINAIIMYYTPIGRVLKKAYVKVINVGGEGEEADGMKVLLADNYEQLRVRLHLLLPEMELPIKEEFVKPPRKLFYLRVVKTALLAVAEGIVLAVALTGVLGTWGRILSWIGIFAMVAAIVVFLGLLSYLKYITSGILCADRYLAIERGTFQKTVAFLPYDKIQYITTRKGPLHRMFQLEKGDISILASSLSQIQPVGTFPREVFAVIEEKVMETCTFS